MEEGTALSAGRAPTTSVTEAIIDPARSSQGSQSVLLQTHMPLLVPALLILLSLWVLAVIYLFSAPIGRKRSRLPGGYFLMIYFSSACKMLMALAFQRPIIGAWLLVSFCPNGLERLRLPTSRRLLQVDDLVECVIRGSLQGVRKVKIVTATHDLSADSFAVRTLRPPSHVENVMLVIAHPDDECM